MIHTYGLASVWLGDLGAAVAWPLMLVSSILSASAWSVLLCEWAGVRQRTMALNAAALCVLGLSVLVTAAGVFYAQ